MRGFTVSLCGLLAGCLYLGDRNHAPEGSIRPLTSSPSRCSGLLLVADARDPDGDEVGYAWSVAVQSAELDLPGRFEIPTTIGSFVCPANSSTGLIPTSAERSTQVIGSVSTLALGRLPLRGAYRVDLLLRDSSGAETWAQPLEFQVSDAVPQILELQLDRDPEVTTYTMPDLDGAYPAHGHYLAWIDRVEDPDDDDRCGNALARRAWEPLGRSAQDFEYWQPVCDPVKVPYGGVRFRLRPEVATAGDLGVRVTLTDAFGGQATRDVHRTVAANRPPCILGTAPYLDATVKLSVAEPNSFYITALSDDVPQLMEFTWSVQDEGAPAFVPLLTQSTLAPPSLTLPAWFRSPGQKLKLRVAVREVGGPEPSCSDASQTRCKWDGANVECDRWVTWSVEFE